jgi:hypothetical protein
MLVLRTTHIVQDLYLLGWLHLYHHKRENDELQSLNLRHVREDADAFGTSRGRQRREDE